MLDRFPAMSKGQQKLTQTIMLATLEYVLEVGLDNACVEVLKDSPNLLMYPELQKWKNNHSV